MDTLSIKATTESETDALAQRLARYLSLPLTISLTGTLGAGKTRFVQGLAAALEIPRDQVLSPTFVLCQQYEGRCMVYHLDAYRIGDDDEFLDLGVDEYFEQPDALTIIEWGDRVRECLPRRLIEIGIEVEEADVRVFTIRSEHVDGQAVISALASEIC